MVLALRTPQQVKCPEAPPDCPRHQAPCRPQGKFPNADPIRHGPHDREARGRLPRPPRSGFPALLTWRLAALPLLHPALVTSSKEERMKSASQIYSRDHDCRASHIHWLVLPIDRSRRLLALHHRLEVVPNHEGQGCHRAACRFPKDLLGSLGAQLLHLHFRTKKGPYVARAIAGKRALIAKTWSNRSVRTVFRNPSQVTL
jgi:hypothetical protein